MSSIDSRQHCSNTNVEARQSELSQKYGILKISLNTLHAHQNTHTQPHTLREREKERARERERENRAVVCRWSMPWKHKLKLTLSCNLRIYLQIPVQFLGDRTWPQHLWKSPRRADQRRPIVEILYSVLLSEKGKDIYHIQKNNGALKSSFSFRRSGFVSRWQSEMKTIFLNSITNSQ